ncbi:response regulator [Ramlibacter sp. XY19]|uniref:response regulator n=1 Tax=Ramlibacter paludis TaxID=2908000 RepID=UPI0023DADA0E|nr:response regulator [Ramlibacter paludis]MCG2593796.1 response regulator [Ramlibacter paludis]
MDAAKARRRKAADAKPRPYADQYVGGFVEAHRQRIFVGLSIAGILLLGPFAVNNFFQDRVMVGIATITFVFCLLANAICIARGRRALVSPLVIFIASAIGLATAMYNNGLIGILWVYPGILLFHFVLPRRTANFFNVSLVLLAVPMAWMHLGPALMARVAVTLTLLIVFANIYSYIADVQQDTEAEQRRRLDGLVQQLEAQNTALLDAIRLREEVERIARHDLKTPLASIASVPRLLRERRALDPRESELVGMVEGAAMRVLSMVNLSLDLYRMEQGTYRLREQAVDLATLVHTVARELEAHARSKRVRLKLDFPSRRVYAQGEELLCYSTLANVAKNALEASPEGGEVRVKIAREDDTVVLAVHNAGEVPAEVRSEFFTKYATHGKPNGHGLGAYSARLMARVQRGDLTMESGPEGTTLTLRLPRWPGAAPSQGDNTGSISRPSPLVSGPLPALDVLLVDDDEYNIIVLRNLLPSPPLKVRTAVNGRAGLDSVRAARPDVIFLDVEMPVMGGIEAIAAIRALQRERGEPPSRVVAFSAHDDEATRQRCLDAGFDLYLAKPASREEVYAVLCGEMPVIEMRDTRASGVDVLVDVDLMPLMPEFLSSRRDLAQQLARAAAGGDREKVRATAHKLAGSLAMYGFEEASQASLEVERAAAGDLAELRLKCDALVRMLAQVQPAAKPA